MKLFSVLHAAPLQKPLTRPPRVLVVSHGLGEHGGRYLHLPHFLAGAVDAVFCVDHRGHGRSEGLRGHVDRFDSYCDDLGLAIRRVAERYGSGGAEIHVLGHSLGGLIALRTLLNEPELPVRSLILSAPLLGIRVEVPFVKKMAAVTLSKLWGSLQLLNELEPGDLTHDPAVSEAYVADRLVHKKITPRLFSEMVATIDKTRKKDSGLAQPLLLLIPAEDRITDAAAATAFFHGLKHEDKQLKTYPGFFHEALNEVGKEKVFQDLSAWILRNAGD
ncbi:MAG: lysophospholipase [Oligoflexia bacterium]|nr:lysophospholipase [Oligoflexia bacterium]